MRHVRRRLCARRGRYAHRRRSLVVAGVIAMSLNYNVTFAEWTGLGMLTSLLWLLVMVIFAPFFFLPVRTVW